MLAVSRRFVTCCGEMVAIRTACGRVVTAPAADNWSWRGFNHVVRVNGADKRAFHSGPTSSTVLRDASGCLYVSDRCAPDLTRAGSDGRCMTRPCDQQDIVLHYLCLTLTSQINRTELS